MSLDTTKLNNDETDSNATEDVAPSNLLGGRKNRGPSEVVPKDQAEDIATKAGEKGAEAVKKDKKSLSIRIDLNLDVQVKLDAHIEGWIEIGLL